MKLDLRKQTIQTFRVPQYVKGQHFTAELYDNGSPYIIDTEHNNVTLEFHSPAYKAYIMTSGITVKDNKVTFYMTDGVTQRGGKGTFNIVITSKDNSVRRSTFTCEYFVVTNSIDCDDVTSEVVTDIVEELQNKINQGNNKISDIENKIKDGETRTNTCVSNINAAISNGNIDTINNNIDTINNNIDTINNNITNIENVSNTVFKQALLDFCYPVGIGTYITQTNTNPGTFLGGTWTLVSQGRVLVGVGTGTDKNNISKTFVAGANEGEYEHKLAEEETPFYACKKESDVGFGLSTGGVGFGGRVAVTNNGKESSLKLDIPSFGVYVWKRTA